MKELDVLLGRFVDAHAPAIARGDFPAFERLLEAEDDCLWDWLQGRATPAEPELRELVEVLRGG